MPRATMIQLRRGTAAEWSAANPILAAGEPGHEYDTGHLKVGDGATRWAALPYVNLRDVVLATDQLAGRTCSSPRGRVADATAQAASTTPAQLTLASVALNRFGYAFWANNRIQPNPALNYNEPTAAANPGLGPRTHLISLQLSVTRPAATGLAALLSLGAVLPLLGSPQSSATELIFEVRLGGSGGAIVAADSRVITQGTRTITFTVPVSIDATWVDVGASLWLSTNLGSVTVNSKRLDVFRAM